MIYYPLTTTMLAGLREILIISTPSDVPRFQQFLGDWSRWGVSLTYAEQPEPKGLTQTFVIGREFVDGRPSVLIFGDNILYGSGFNDHLRQANTVLNGATVFGYHVGEHERYGVAEIGQDGRVLSI